MRIVQWGAERQEGAAKEWSPERATSGCRAIMDESSLPFCSILACAVVIEREVKRHWVSAQKPHGRSNLASGRRSLQ